MNPVAAPPGSGKVGIGSFALAWAIGVPGRFPRQPLDLHGFIARAAELEAEVVQIGDNLPLENLTARELAELLRLSSASGIGLEVGTRGMAHDHLLRYLDIAGALQSSLLRLVMDSPGDEPEPAEVVRRLKPLLPHLESSGVVLALENHDRFHAATLAGIIRELDSDHVAVCLDTVNSLGVLEGPDIVLETLGPLVASLHVKDFRIARHGHNMGFTVTGTPAGQGMLDIPGTLERLRRFGRSPNLILELWPAPEADIEATVEKEWDWAVTSMNYLRQTVAEVA